MNELPIDEEEGEFVEALGAEGPTVTVAPTGSGKSTRLPLWMDDELDGPVLVVEPRRVACRSLAEYLAGQRGEQAGESIGYRVRFDDCTSERTRVMFATTGVVLRMLGSEEPWPFAGVVVDEFHERGWEVDLIVATLRRRTREPGFGPFVLTSATIRAEVIAAELGADLVESEGRTHPVDIEYAGEPVAPTGDDLDRRVREAVPAVVEAPDDDGGDILVFLPGKGEISDCKRALGGVASEHGLELLEVHGRLPPGEMAEAFDDEGAGRRVYLSTNVAETSVTLPGVTTVIDSGLVKMKIHRGGRSALALVPTSQASMDQRAGRAGRVQPGRCIRLWSERYRPEETTPPEIERIELDEVILHAGCCGLDGEAFDRAEWLTEPPEFAVEQARERLRRVGALDADDELTDLGRRLAELPVDAHDARMLIDPPEHLKGTLADLVALLQRSTDLLLPMGMVSNPGEVKQHRNRLLKECDNEIDTQVRCLRDGYPREHGLHRSAWEEAKKVSASLREMIDAPAADPRRDEAELPSMRELASFLLERIPEYAFVLRERARSRRRDGQPKPGRSEPWGNGEIELDVYPFEPPVDERVRDTDVEYPEAGLVLSVFWVGGRGPGIHGIGDMLVPATKGQLAEAGLGEVQPAEVSIEGGGLAPRIVAELERNYAGVTLRTEEDELEGRTLCEAVADLVMEGRLFDGAAEALRTDLHLWRLLGEWPDEERYWSGADEVPEPREYLAERLWELGLRESDDLALLEADDLRPDLAERLGIAEFEIERWREEFPRTWEYMGREYQCQVQPSVGKVILEPVNKKAKKEGEPEAKHLPRFRGFDVVYRNASRVVPLR